MIHESILTTLGADGSVHVAPFGLIERGDELEIAPFVPSATLENLRARPHAVASYTDDVRVFAGCLSGRREWPTWPARRVPGAVLEGALSHAELAVTGVQEQPERPRFRCRVVHEETHSPFRGFNRAQAAVVEGAILVSRLHLLPRERVERELAHLGVAVEKTAGPREREAWGWLMAVVAGAGVGA